MSISKLVTILLLILIFSLLFIFFLVFRFDRNFIPLLDDNSIKDTVRFELIKNLLNLSLLTIVGGLIAYLFKSREIAQKREQDIKDELRKQEQIRIEIRMDYFKRLGNIYRNIKNARRALRAGGLTTAYLNGQDDPPALLIRGVYLDLYREQMEVVNKYQLELEGLKLESRSLPAFVHLSNVHIYLGTMEDYLRKILNEFEAVSPLLKSGKAVHFKQLERLDEFTGRVTKNREFCFSKGKPPNIDYRFTESFSDLYDEVIEEIGKNLS
ncbi:hypothetical protein [Pseudobacter ginsenosidimutans]|uniref:Phage abortive infection protein n=1 Tax=Pseudobacter ginsenosidimutans TaxID=661488 RepID=A0A4Q7N4M9_9BACT|nr:hypothetical protein [Pseudobacter ginsenosidimutans]QEC44486.1 hypothetical protein FSB84_23440 [Pseudobacter ginsenosidimutans]RZS75958.1 hypothetical protein EV199_1834 [Pseudobacter ginsenosidimutans]